MFVLKRTYIKLMEERDFYIKELHGLAGKYNSLIDKYNAVRNAGNRLNRSTLDDEFIKKMLMLCHPDKHGGKKMEQEVTQKLLSMRTK